MRNTLVFCLALACIATASNVQAQTNAQMIAASKKLVLDSMKDPESTRFRNIKLVGPVTVCGEVNSKNSMGGYVGFKRFFALGARRFVMEGDDAFESSYGNFCLGIKSESPYITSARDRVRGQFSASYPVYFRDAFVTTKNNVCGTFYSKDPAEGYVEPQRYIVLQGRVIVEIPGADRFSQEWTEFCEPAA